MIASLTGQVQVIEGSLVILNVSGVGYELIVSPVLSASLKVGQDATIFTAHVVRYDSESLFGFASYSERQLFDLLITVSGIGPKLALLILSSFSLTDIIGAVQHAKPELFESVSGIGRKNAQRIIVELQSKLGSLEDLDLGDFSERSGVVEALMSLGYRGREIKEALRDVDGTLAPDEQIRAALRG